MKSNIEKQTKQRKREMVGERDDGPRSGEGREAETEQLIERERGDGRRKEQGLKARRSMREHILLLSVPYLLPLLSPPPSACGCAGWLLSLFLIAERSLNGREALRNLRSVSCVCLLCCAAIFSASLARRIAR